MLWPSRLQEGPAPHLRCSICGRPTKFTSTISIPPFTPSGPPWFTITRRFSISSMSPLSLYKEWKRWRNVYLDNDASRLDRGFAAFYLNRCNRSGIIQNGGVIGGIDQTGSWKIDARFNKDTLRQRLERIYEDRDRISVSNLDGIEFIDTLDPESTLYLVDPPYFKKGPLLYLNGLDADYHARLAEKFRSMEDAPWVLTYDDCSEIRDLYEGWAAIHPFSLRYTARERRRGNEVLIAPKWIHLPEAVSGPALSW